MELFHEVLDADGLVGDEGINLAVRVVAHDVQDGEDAPREHRDQHGHEAGDALGGGDDVEDVAIGPLFPVFFFAAVCGLKVERVAGLGLHLLDGIDAQWKPEVAKGLAFESGIDLACHHRI